MKLYAMNALRTLKKVAEHLHRRGDAEVPNTVREMRRAKSTPQIILHKYGVRMPHCDEFNATHMMYRYLFFVRYMLLYGNKHVLDNDFDTLRQYVETSNEDVFKEFMKHLMREPSSVAYFAAEKNLKY